MQIKFFSLFSQPSYFLLRLFSGLLFCQHGAQKLFGVLGREAADAPLMIVAGIVEFFGGLFIAIGLLTQIAALLAAGQMLVAYFMAHAPQGFWPILNNGELALLYMFIFLYIMSRGPGRFAMDSYIKREPGPRGT
ncbi:MAG TPA: DoxX family protein [Acidobacteriota bacterium]|jgi:putative oxidoreductase|nr:DoxX family protein [Acidobacteriota bacterium]